MKDGKDRFDGGGDGVDRGDGEDHGYDVFGSDDDHDDGDVSLRGAGDLGDLDLDLDLDLDASLRKEVIDMMLKANPGMTAASLDLVSLMSYIKEHPTERFWQALRNWSGWDFIFTAQMRGPSAFEGPVSVGFLAEDLHDTFYWIHTRRPEERQRKRQDDAVVIDLTGGN